MRIEQLVNMVNEIAAFFHGAGEESEVAESVANHLSRYWDPRMRKQIVGYLEGDAAELTSQARAGVEVLARRYREGSSVP